MNFFKKVGAMALLGCSSLIMAGEAEIKEKLSVAMPLLTFSEITPSKQMPGMFRVVASGRVIYSNEDGSHFMLGDLFQVNGEKITNISEMERNQETSKAVNAIPPSEKITFPAKGEKKASVTVFTDIDCGYCRKLHSEVPAMNEMGIEVNYLAFPRNGVGSASFNKSVSAWCAEDKLQAITDAKQGKQIEQIKCANPVENQYTLGKKVGVTGTPAIFTDSGQLIPGYVSADKLGSILNIL